MTTDMRVVLPGTTTFGEKLFEKFGFPVKNFAVVEAADVLVNP